MDGYAKRWIGEFLLDCSKDLHYSAREVRGSHPLFPSRVSGGQNRHPVKRSGLRDVDGPRVSI